MSLFEPFSLHYVFRKRRDVARIVATELQSTEVGLWFQKLERMARLAQKREKRKEKPVVISLISFRYKTSINKLKE